MSRLHVVFQIRREDGIDDVEIDRKRIKTFLAERTVESFNVRIIVRLSHSRMAMPYLYTLGEVRTELTPIVRLHTAEEEWRCHLCLLDE
jgi:hypothetical protein